MTAKMTIERLGYMMRDAFGSAFEWDARAKKLVEILAESKCAIVAVPEREISDEDLGIDVCTTHTSNVLCATVGERMRERLLAAGYHVTRVVADEDHKQDIAIEGFHAALRALAPLLDVDAPKAIGTDVAAKELADAIRKKFAPAEKTAEEREFVDRRDELLTSIAHVLMAGGTEYGFASKGGCASLFVNSCDPVALSNGKLKPRQPRKWLTLEEFLARKYAVTLTEGPGTFTVRHELGFSVMHPDLNRAYLGMREEAKARFKRAVDRGEDLPMPGEGK